MALALFFMTEKFVLCLLDISLGAGPIPSTLGNLTALTLLNLPSNQLTGKLLGIRIYLSEYCTLGARLIRLPF